jgi:hypothetical protein
MSPHLDILFYRRNGFAVIRDGDGARARGIYRDGADLIVASDLSLQRIDPCIDARKKIVATRIKRRGVNIIPIRESYGPR